MLWPDSVGDKHLGHHTLLLVLIVPISTKYNVFENLIQPFGTLQESCVPYCRVAIRNQRVLDIENSCGDADDTNVFVAKTVHHRISRVEVHIRTLMDPVPVWQ